MGQLADDAPSAHDGKSSLPDDAHLPANRYRGRITGGYYHCRDAQHLKVFINARPFRLGVFFILDGKRTKETETKNPKLPK